MKVISIALFLGLAACTPQPQGSALPSPRQDTIPEKRLPDCFALYQDLFHATAVMSRGDSCQVEIVHPGDLHVTSGRIVLGDPVMLKDLRPIAALFPVGDFQPEVIRLRTIQSKWAVNALLRVRFSNDPPQQWKFALPDSALMDSADVHAENFFGFGVDAGSALLYDADNQQALMQMDFDALWADSIRVRPKFIAFSTGQGDGLYPAYVGFDSTGLPCQLIVDFLQVECKCLPRSSALRDP